MFYGERKVFESFTCVEDITGEPQPKRVFFCSKKCLTHYFYAQSSCLMEGDSAYLSIPWNVRDKEEESDD